MSTGKDAMELKRPSLTLSGLLAAGSLVLLATTVVLTWFTLLPPGTVPFFYDLDSYRDTLDAVAGGALMFDWLGYPPVTLILLSPLRGLPELAGDQLWTGTSFVMILALAAALSKLATEARAASGQKAPPTFLVMFGFAGALLFPSEPMSNQLVSGQLSLAIVTLAFIDASGLLPRKWQGSLVGLAAAFKLTPLIFFPYYLITRQWRQAAVAAASFCVATGVGFLLFPRDSLYFWTHTDSSGRLGTNRIDNVSVLGTLSRWMADPAQTKLLWYGFALVIGLAAFWRAWQHYRRHEQVEAALVIGCASTAISPIAWPHYQIWLVLAALWLILSGTRRSMIIGALIYLVYSLLFAVPVVGAIAASADPSQALIPRILWELNVLVPVLISVLGLPRRVTKGAGSEPAAGLGSGQPVVPAAVVG